jgi:type IV pilus assembly protein PilF
VRTRDLASLAALALACAHGPSGKEREASEIHYNLGLEALRGGRFAEGLKEFGESLKIDERFAEAHVGKGLALELGFSRLDEAEREYRRAAELRPALAEAHNNLGQLLAKQGRLDEAVKEFDTALGNMLYKEPWVARCNKGQALYRMGQREQGLAEMEACLTQNPRFCEGHRELGRIQLSEGRVRQAIQSFGHYAKACDRAPDAFYQLGVAHLRAGDAERAREAFEKCVGLAGEGPLGEECRRSRERLQ